jgi:hypothetical protein
MSFSIFWLPKADAQYAEIRAAALAPSGTDARDKAKSSRAQGLFKQVHKCLQLLAANPRHPGLQTHEYHSIQNPCNSKQKVFEAYVQNRTPGAYRVFWCYGPGKNQITILAITPHP